ncbi:MAG: MliC family protein [Rickettsiales bacterium]|jgi:membrane-bound inhibitor of C-type lysozyme|nr:MliC family protein [Rickettsiales bacterium]
MKKLALVASVFLAACESPKKEPERFQLKCGKYAVAVEVADADTLNTAVNGEKIQMFSAVSASGAKYEGKGAVVKASLWNKGANWSLIINNGRMIDCKSLKK